MAVIAELKRRSPSLGELAREVTAAGQARRYQAGGAAALSVLCDRAYFGGSLADLAAARAACALPVLCKDFILEEEQLLAARRRGPTGCCSSAAALEPARLRDLHQAAHGPGLAPLVEVHAAEELEAVLAVGPLMVGINTGTCAPQGGTGRCLALGPWSDPILTVAGAASAAPPISPASGRRLRGLFGGQRPDARPGPHPGPARDGGGGRGGMTGSRSAGSPTWPTPGPRVALGAQALGFDAGREPPPESPRPAKALVAALPPWWWRWGCWWTPHWREARELRAYCGFDLLQLHGGESPAMVAALGGRVIRPWRWAPRPPIPRPTRRRPAFGRPRPGGGRPFAWPLAQEICRAGR